MSIRSFFIWYESEPSISQGKICRIEILVRYGLLESIKEEVFVQLLLRKSCGFDRFVGAAGDAEIGVGDLWEAQLFFANDGMLDGVFPFFVRRILG